MKRKKELFLILALLAVCAVLYFFAVAGNEGKTAKRSLIVYVDGEEYLRTPLEAGKTIRVPQENGAENVIRMTENGFFMESSTCPNQDCVKQGEVTVGNWKRRKLLEQVICLPNRVTVALELTDTEASDPDLPDV